MSTLPEKCNECTGGSEEVEALAIVSEASVLQQHRGWKHRAPGVRETLGRSGYGQKA